MKITKIILFLVMLFVLIPTSLAWNTAQDTAELYEFSNDALSSISFNHLTNGGVGFSTNSIPDDSYSADTDNSNILTNLTFGNPTFNFSHISTISMWVNATAGVADDTFFAIGGANPNRISLEIDGGGSFIRWTHYDGTLYTNNACGSAGTTPEDLGNWHMYTIVWNATDTVCWRDATLIGNASVAVGDRHPDWDDLYIGKGIGAATESDALIDNLFMTTTEWVADNVTTAYNSGAGVLYIPVSETVGEMSVSLLTPATAAKSNIQREVTYNATATNSSISSCDLYSNFTGSYILNETNSTPILNNSINTFDLNNFTNFGYYSWNVTCSDLDGNIGTGTGFTFTNELNYSYVFPETSLEFTEVTTTFTINTTIDLTTSAGFYYNGSLLDSTKTQVDDTDVYSVTYTTPKGNGTQLQADWIYNVTGAGGISLQNVSFNQTLTGIFIDNCSIYAQEAINFTMMRDDTDTLIDASMDGYFKIWIEAAGSFRDFNLSWGNGKNHSICIFPSTGSYNVFGQLEYSTTTAEFAEKTYYLTNATLDNTTEYINLYLTPNSTSVTFSVDDENDDSVSDVYIHILKYDLATNSHVTNSIIRTGENGEAIGEIVLTTQWYKFLLVLNGETKLESEPVKITSTTRNFRINLAENDFAHYDEATNVTTGLTFTNSTGNFAFTWVNPTGIAKRACLNVIRRSITDDVEIGETCQNAASGTILINAGDTLDYTFIATGTISGSPFLLTNMLEVSFDEGYKKWGKDGIFASFFLRLALALTGIWNPVVAIIMLILADIGMMAMGLYSWSWTTFVVYIIMAFITMIRVGKK